MVACGHCGAILEATTSRRRFCSAKCRKAAWSASRSARLATIEATLERTLGELRALRGIQKG